MCRICLIPVVLIVAVSIAGCDLREQEIQTIRMNYSGDGVLKYIPKHGLLASKGVLLQFDTFDLSAGYDRLLSLNGLPVLGQNYYLVFFPEKIIDNETAKNVIIKTILQDGIGNILWQVDSRLNQWMVSEGGGMSEYCYIHTDITGCAGCKFSPQNNEIYKLSITCKYQGKDEQNICGMAHFYLRSGGFK